MTHEQGPHPYHRLEWETADGHPIAYVFPPWDGPGTRIFSPSLDCGLTTRSMGMEATKRSFEEMVWGNAETLIWQAEHGEDVSQKRSMGLERAKRIVQMGRESLGGHIEFKEPTDREKAILHLGEKRFSVLRDPSTGDVAAIVVQQPWIDSNS